MENCYNSLTIFKENYSNKEEYYMAIANTIITLLNNKYNIISLSEIPNSFVVFQYNYAEPEMGAPYPTWISQDDDKEIKNYND